MIDLLKRKNTIEVDKTDMFITENDIQWNGITILKDSLVVLYDGWIYVNEAPLIFFTILKRLYGDKLSDFKNGDIYIFNHSENCNLNILGVDEKVTIRNGSLARWYLDHFCYSGPPNIKSLDEIPTFKYKDRTYSSWGYQFNIITHEIEGGIYNENGKYYEMTNGDMSNWEIKS